MQPNLKTSGTPMQRLRATVGGVLTAALLLSVPVFAVSAVASWGHSATQQIESGDDAVANGLRIVRKESAGVVRGNAREAFADQPAETVLRGWRYTQDKTGSPGH